MKNIFIFCLTVILTVFCSCSKYSYESVKGDPTGTRIYTLENGLKVYLAQNTDKPRIQTFVAVKVGAKNDPLETTGLAHYFEHLMFKGTEKFGTKDFESEKPLLDKIEELFEVYRKETDQQKRTEIYAEIDSISQEASKLAIPNEYDKLMAAIGSEGTNAWTSFDETCYTEDIPANQIENWAAIQYDRFRNATIRGFHTELETVYEEFNMSLTNDGNKEYYKLLEILYPEHPYGMHSVLGKQEHLKNPSITNIKNYYKTFYVPNNMAVCMAGDLDFDRTIAIIDKYFGKLKPNNNLPEWTIAEEKEITSPLSAEVVGLEAENIILSWRAPKASDKESTIADLLSSVLYNGKCGLIDVDVNQSQKVLGANAGFETFADHGLVILEGLPRQGQTLDEVKDILMAEITKLRNGEFDENIISSAIANYKRSQMRQLESNAGIARSFINSFINDIQWEDICNELEYAGTITKDDIVAWANKNLRDDNIAVIYKRKGVDTSVKKIEKPHITPIQTNRNDCSAFLDSMKKVEVEPIAPVFVDYSRDMSIGQMKQSIPVLYKQNVTNGLFSLTYVYETGKNVDPVLDIAAGEYMPLLGTESKTLEEIQKELYSLACNFNISVGATRTNVSISGLGDNMDKAVAVVEDYIKNLKGNDEILSELKKDILKSREDIKLNQRSNFSAANQYCQYGKDVIRQTTLDNDQLMSLTSEELVSRIKNLQNFSHRVLYYGPLTEDELIAKLNEDHYTANSLITPENKEFTSLPTDRNRVIFAQYDAKQIYYQQYSCADEKYDINIEPCKTLFNEYFGGSMGSIVFQEMREARGLAYSANAKFREGTTCRQPYVFTAFIATQNDKLRQAKEAFEEIIENMPESENAFQIAKQSLLTSLATSRITKEAVLRSWLNAQDYGIDYDRNRNIYEKVRDMTLQDVKDFHAKHVKGRNYNYVILGDGNDVDMNYLKSLGEVEIVSQKDIFGF